MSDKTKFYIILSVLIAAIAGAAMGGKIVAWRDREDGAPCSVHHMVIIGDSNVFAMNLGSGCVNLGVSGNTSRMMAARFNAKEIAALKQKTLVIWTPSNEVHDMTGDGVRYIRQMAEDARAAGLRVILTTPLPMIDNSLLPPRGRQTQAQVNTAVALLDSQVRALSQSEHFPIADVHGAVVSQDGSLNAALFAPDNDGTLMHLNRNGQRAVWRVIAPLTAD